MIGVVVGGSPASRRPLDRTPVSDGVGHGKPAADGARAGAFSARGATAEGILGDAAKRAAARASRGDVAAFSRLVEKHSDLVRGVALRVVGADDACQEVWVRAWRHAAGFRGDSAFRTWLYRVATNACLDLRRARLRRLEDAHGGDPAVGVAVASGGDSDPEASALGSERRQEVRAALERVRADHRAALVLRHAEGLSYAEIAASLGVPAGTAKGWASRGRSSLTAALAAERSGARTRPAG